MVLYASFLWDQLFLPSPQPPATPFPRKRIVSGLGGRNGRLMDSKVTVLLGRNITGKGLWVKDCRDTSGYRKSLMKQESRG